RLGRLLDLLESHTPEEQEATVRPHDTSPAQLGDPPQLPGSRAASGTQKTRASGRGVAQPDAAPAVAAEAARDAQHAARGIATAVVVRAAEITHEAEQERRGEPEPAAPLGRADPLPGLAARKHLEQDLLARLRRRIDETHADQITPVEPLVEHQLGGHAHASV